MHVAHIWRSLIFPRHLNVILRDNWSGGEESELADDEAEREVLDLDKARRKLLLEVTYTLLASAL